MKFLGWQSKPLFHTSEWQELHLREFFGSEFLSLSRRESKSETSLSSSDVSENIDMEEMGSSSSDSEELEQSQREEFINVMGEEDEQFTEGDESDEETQVEGTIVIILSESIHSYRRRCN